MRRAHRVGVAIAGCVVLAGVLWTQRAALSTRVHHPPEALVAQRLDEVQARFAPDAVVSGPTALDCELSGGTKTTCISISLKAEPASYTAGPWCPRHIDDGPERSGIWFARGDIYPADGAFIANLETFYDDDGWQMYDPSTGDVNLKAGAEGCEIAADPHPKQEHYNHCIECDLPYLPEPRVATYVFPVEPIPGAWGDSAIPAQTNVGVSFDGPAFDGPAPIDAILASYTLGLLDRCGGHINPHVGYHIHAVMDCTTSLPASGREDAPRIGLAMDGYPILARLDDPAQADLDACGGHETSGSGYHYHAASPGSNQILGCFHGEAGYALRGE